MLREEMGGRGGDRLLYVGRKQILRVWPTASIGGSTYVNGLFAFGARSLSCFEVFHTVSLGTRWHEQTGVSLELSTCLFASWRGVVEGVAMKYRFLLYAVFGRIAQRFAP